MYNAVEFRTFAALLQQAKKKPLVTELLPERCYRWGWRCKLIMTDSYALVKSPSSSPLDYRRMAVVLPTETSYTLLSHITKESGKVVPTGYLPLRNICMVLPGSGSPV